MNKITSFAGEFAFLSNFYRCQVELDGVIYPSVENAYQAAKTLKRIDRIPFADPSTSSGKAKKLGRRLSLRQDWESVKIDLMRRLVADKFSRNPQLAIQLAATVDAQLIEGNYWGDTFWGVCEGVGKNWLGIVLMEVRAKL